ncbi:MAG: CPBP family intramembrane metalloprotease [Anaerolineae bacterium]|nr:CPBP family intramembrane metalloprotease [Anaerolineae bacterium]
MKRTWRLPESWKIPFLLIASTQLILLDYYRNLTPWYYLDRFLLHLVIPIVFIVFLLRENPSQYGFQLGDWRTGLKIALLSAILIFPAVWLAAHFTPSLSRYYQPQYHPAAPFQLILDLLGWEFLFRGWLLFGLERQFGRHALWMQAVPFAIAHLGKPELETLTTIFGGYFFGWVAWRTRSYLYPVLIHWCIAVAIILASAGRLG